MEYGLSIEGSVRFWQKAWKMVKVLKKIIYAEAQLDEIACVPHGLYKMGLSGMNISGSHSKR